MAMFIHELHQGELPEFVEFWLGPGATAEAMDAKKAKFEWLLSQHMLVAPEMPFGWLARQDDKLVGGKLCLATEVSSGGRSVIVAMSSSFRVAPGHGNAAVLLFKRYMQLGTKHPLLATSTNAASARLWQAFGGVSLQGSESDWVWLGKTRRAREEVLFRKIGKARLAQIASRFGRDAASMSLPTSEPRPWDPLPHTWHVPRTTRYWDWRISQAPTGKVNYCSVGSSAWVVGDDRGGHRGHLKLLRLLDWNTEDAITNAKAAIGLYDGLVANFADGLQCHGFHPTKLDAPRGWILDRATLLGNQPLRLRDADSDSFS